MSSHPTIRFLRLFSLLFLTTVCFSGSEWLEDVADQAGLKFVHFNGMTGQFSIAEVIGSGAALWDYDNDGDLDVYLVQGAEDPISGAGQKPLFPLKPGQVAKDRLFRNDLKVTADGEAQLRFTDVTDQSGIDSRGYGMGVAVADVDGDGYLDLYITNYGADQLWRNQGNGRFTDITAEAGPFNDGWSTSATFFDYDRDGDQDLFVAQYLNYTRTNHKSCRTAAGKIDYCGPKTYEAVSDRLYENQGKGKFRDVTTQMGIHRAFGAGLGVVAADFNGDLWPDLFVANDGAANQLWINQKGRGFVDEGILAGCALNADGNPEASMGVALADFDDDGDRDLFLTHLRKETNTLYVNDGNGWFEDRTIASGLGAASTAYTAFGTGWLDLDNDGALDLLALNGTVQIIDELRIKGDPYPLHQPNQLFKNKGKGRFEDVSSQAGRVFQLSEVSRGAAFGDIDNDGDTDVLITNNQGAVRLLRNQVGQKRPWLGIVPRQSNGQVVTGAMVKVGLAKGSSRWRWSQSDGSFLCANDPRVLLGLAEGERPISVSIDWGDGLRESWAVNQTKTYLTLKRGSGTRLKAPVSP